MKMYAIRELRPEEAVGAASLIAKVFGKFVASDFSENGVRHFHEFITPEGMRKRLAENSIILVACHDERIVGVVEIRDCAHIALLFTSEDWHGRGIARKLLDAAIERCLEKMEVPKVTVNSSSYAIPVYKKLGFTISGREQTVNGIRFTPMSKYL